MTLKIIPLSEVRLSGGTHDKDDEKVCLLECVSLYDPARDAIVFDGHRKTDYPDDVSGVIGEFGRLWNDPLAQNRYDAALHDYREGGNTAEGRCRAAFSYHMDGPSFCARLAGHEGPHS